MYFCITFIIINKQITRKQAVLILLSKILFFQKSIANITIENNSQNRGSTNMVKSIIQLRIFGQASIPHPSLFKYKKNQTIGKDIETNNNRNIRL
jgi:hypothetical protein